MANVDHGQQSAAESADHGQEQTAASHRTMLRPRRSIGRRILQAIVALTMAFVVAAIAALATSQLGYAVPAFVLVFVASAVYLYAKPIPSAAIGSGLYLTAIALLLTPILYLLPELAGEGSFEGMEAAGPIVEELLALVAVAVFLASAFVEEALSLFVMGVETAVESFGGVLGLAVWALAFVVVALVLAAIGYLANRRARRKLTVR